MTITRSIGAPLAAQNSSPAFPQWLAIGQHNTPGWERYVAAMRDIFTRRYYTNQGPLAREFEQRLQAFLGVKHAVCVTNGTIGLMMASEALGVAGKVLVPAVRSLPLQHALSWCGVEPIACDVEPSTGQISLERATEAVESAENTGAPAAIVGANLWGGACRAEALTELASRHHLPVLFDSTHAFGCIVEGGRAGRFGALEVYSFGDSDVLNAAGGACVATDDDELAARLRNIRSSYGAGRPVPVVKTSNGRLSEAQAALGLLSLEDFAVNQAHNQSLIAVYRSCLSGIAGLRVVDPSGVDLSNHQTLVIEIDEHAFGMTCDGLVRQLAADNVEARAVSDAYVVERQGAALPAAAKLDASWCELPVGAHVCEATVKIVCELMAQASDRRSA